MPLMTCNGPQPERGGDGEWNIYAEHEVEQCVREECGHRTLDRQNALTCCECGSVTCSCCTWGHTVTCTAAGCSNAACEACIHPMDPEARAWVCTGCADGREAWEGVACG